jgi:acyl-CoA synthetase (AMP-forming)/AMP-acid ligase II
MSTVTLPLLLEKLQAQTENATAKFIWLGSDGKEEETLTGVQIYQRAGAVAHMLVAAKLKQGDRAMIAYPPGLDFLAALIGCARAGVICCSVYPPDPSKLNKTFAHFCSFAKDAGTDYVLTTSTMKKIMQGAALLHGPRGLKYIVTDSAKKSPKPFVDVQIQDKDIMFIQYSSGSTGVPKGVMISHGALVRNIQLMAHAAGTLPHDSACCWLPQYHDYGLVCNYLKALHLHTTLVCMSPFTFLRSPLVWCSTLSKYSINHTCGPNFAYALLHRKWVEAGKPPHNLTKLRNASIAAEPIASDTIDKMVELGILRTAIHPSYGLAENVILATSDLPSIGPSIHEGRVSCGRAEFGPKHIHVNGDGEIFVQGDDLASGYWNRPELTRETFHNILPGLDGEWLSTGDLGFIHDGLLYVTGRKKELIKVRGKNYFPTDIETDVEKEFGEFLRPGCSAAFQHTEASVGYVAEVRDEKRIPDTIKIQQHILAEHGVQCTYIKLVPKGSLPKTTSGKIKRVQVQADAQSATTSTSSSSGLDTSSFIQALGGTGNNTLDLDKSIAENGADSMTQVQIENELAAKRVLTERQRNMLRSGSSLREIAQELVDSPERPRNIEVISSPIRKARILPISTFIRGTGMCIINFINLAIPLSIAGAVYEMTVQWGGILVWAAMHTACVALCLRLFTFGGTDSFEVGCNSTAYLRWYFCRNMLAIWNAFIGTWLAGTFPYVLFLRFIGARVHTTAVVDHLFEYVDSRLQVGPYARVGGICDTGAHVNVKTMRFGPIVIGQKTNVRGYSRMWPGSRIGDESTLDSWCRLYFDEHVSDHMDVCGYPSYAKSTSPSSHAYVNGLWRNVSRLVVIPSITIAAFIIASYVAVGDPFFQYITTFLLGFVLIVVFAPIFKTVLIDVLNGGPNVSETVDQLSGIAFNAIWCWLCPSCAVLWNVYIRSFGAKIDLNTLTAMTIAGSASQASRLTVKNDSFIGVGVWLSGTGPVVIDNCECALGSVVPEGGLSDKQLLRHGQTRPRCASSPTVNRNNLILETIVSLSISWFVSASLIMSVYPLYLAGVFIRQLIPQTAAFVPAFFIPAILLQTVVIFPIVVRIVQLILKPIHRGIWFTAYYFIRIYGSVAFFAGSPIHNVATNLSGSKVDMTSMIYNSVSDEDRITVDSKVVVDMYSKAAAHLYSQREYVQYNTKMITNTLYEGPAMYVGDPAKQH